MTRTRRSIGAAVAAMALVAVAATQHAGASAEDVTLSYFTFSAAPDHLEDLDSIVAAFEAEHPNVQVEVQTAAYADYFTSLQTQIAGGSAPDTFELNYENFVTYARSGALLDLGSVRRRRHRPGPLLPAGPRGIHGRRDSVRIAGDVLQRRAHLQQDPVRRSGTRLSDGGVDVGRLHRGGRDAHRRRGRNLRRVPAGVLFEFYKSLAQAGGVFFDADGNAAFNSPEGVAAAEWLTSKPGTVMPTLADIGGTPDFDTALFTSGKLAMWHNGIWQFAGLNESGVDYDIVVEPGDAQQANAVFMNGAVASAGTDHPDEAALWIAFLTGSPTTVDTRLASSWELPAVSDEEAFASYLEITPPDNRQAVFDALDHIALPPVIERQQEMQDIVTQALERIVADGADIQEALDEAAAEVDGLTG